jgi:hypothetical protein
VKIHSHILNLRRGLFRIWTVLSVIFILCVAFYRYDAIQTEFYRNSYVYGLVISPNQYGNENLLPVSCTTARGKEDSTLLTGYAKLSIGPPPIREQSVGELDLSAGLVPRGSGSPPNQEQDGDGIVWDTSIGDAASVKAEVIRQVANLHVDPSANSGFKTTWCWYRASTFRPLYPEYQHTSDNSLVMRLYRRAGLYGLLTFDESFHPWTLLFQTIGLAIGVPLAMLALGSACYWALAGFRNPS